MRSLLAALAEIRAPARPVVWRPQGNFLCPLPAAQSLGLGAEPLRAPPTRWRDFARLPSTWGALGAAGGDPAKVPLHLHPRHRTAPDGTWVLLPELIYTGDRAEQLLAYVHRRGWRLAVVLHDTIPVDHPEFAPAALTEDHARYLRTLSRADLILPNSEFTSVGWRSFLQREKLPAPPVRVCPLACDLPGVARSRELAPPPAASGEAAPVRLLCVSTLEPRKNHRALFAAYELAVARRPDLQISLDLVGAPYVGASDLVDLARALVARHPGRVRWHERIEHGALQRLYAACDFSVYPSLVEGFGLPIIESLWFAQPCLCANFGVMAENAHGGGCLTCDVREPHALAEAIIQLAADPALRRRLAQEAAARPLKTWREYAVDVLDALRR